MRKMALLPHDLRYLLSCDVPAKHPKREFKVGDKIRVHLHHGKIEDAVVRAVIEDTDGTKLQVPNRQSSPCQNQLRGYVAHQDVCRP